MLMTEEPRRVQPWSVRITSKGAGRLHGLRLLEAGQVIELPVAEAIQRVQMGEAEWTLKVRALKANIQIGNVATNPGDVCPCAPDRARKLADAGLVEILPHDYDPATHVGKPLLPDVTFTGKTPDKGPSVQVRALRENVSAMDGKVLGLHETGRMQPDRAQRLASEGVVAILNPISQVVGSVVHHLNPEPAPQRKGAKAR